MGNLNFHEDIKIGQTNEQVVIDVFEREYNAVYVGESKKENGNLKEFDLLIDELIALRAVAEVKTEDKWVQPGRWLPNGAYFPGIDTGNICIEFRMHGKDSGIMVTKSDLWVIVFMNIKEIWVIRTEKLKKLLSQNNFNIKIGGDEVYVGTNIKIPEEKRSHMYLIPRKNFEGHFTVLKY